MNTNRLEAFSDGVFAIVITLLVIEIRLPEDSVGALGLALAGLWPSYLAYAISFIVIGAIWINHHGMFLHIAKTDNGFLLLNVLQLMVIAFIPFPTAVLAEAIAARSDIALATTFYGATLVAVGLSVNLMWRYAIRSELLKEHLGEAKVKLAPTAAGSRQPNASRARPCAAKRPTSASPRCPTLQRRPMNA